MKKKIKLNKKGKLVLLFVFIILFSLMIFLLKPNKENNHVIISEKLYNMKIDFNKTNIKNLDKEISSYIEKDDFIKIVNESKDVITSKYDFIIDAQNVIYNDVIYVNIVSYSYTGGAHYVREDKTFIYDKNEKKYIDIKDIIKDNNSFEELALLVKHGVNKLAEENKIIIDKDWLDDGAKAKKSNYEHFFMDKTGMTVIFPQYQVESWADGEIKVMLKYEDINRLLKKEYQNANYKEEKEEVLNVQNRDLTKFKNKKLVSFTFDDGPNTKTTSRLLEGMKELDAKATFFVLGSRVPYNKDVLKRAYEEGNQIGTHTQNHKNLKHVGDDEFLYEVSMSKKEIKNVIGTEPTLLRPPYGNINEHQKNLILMHTINWNVDSKDWKLKDRNLIKEEILKHAKDGSIILLHDIYTESVEGALLAMRELKEQGYEFVTIDEIVRLKGIKLDYTTTYYGF